MLWRSTLAFNSALSVKTNSCNLSHHFLHFVDRRIMSATNAGGYCNAKDDMREDFSQTKCCITLLQFYEMSRCVFSWKFVVTCKLFKRVKSNNRYVFEMFCSCINIDTSLRYAYIYIFTLSIILLSILHIYYHYFVAA